MSPRNRLRFFLTLLATCALLAPAPASAQTTTNNATAQSPPVATDTPASAATAQSPLVKLNVIVADKENRAVDDMRREDFRVVEDGVEQTITHFSQDALPVSYGLVIDNSGSLRSQFLDVLRATVNIVETNHPEDETFIVRFVSFDKIERVQDFTSDKDVLIQAFRRLYPDRGQTALIDAVYASAAYLIKSRGGDRRTSDRRRALVLITDGEDRASIQKPDALFDMLRDADIQIFVVGLVSALDNDGGLIRQSPRAKSVDLMTRLASQTGGRAFFLKKPEELPDIAREIAHDLRKQYVVGYVPAPNPKSKPYRKVEIKLAKTPGRDKRIAITRPGYSVEMKNER